jgi:FtsP/CotA-like multicopper oxidase with cupredoxin domain
LRKYFEDPDKEIIMHMQTIMMAVDRDGNGPGSNVTGPTDDAYISVSTKSTPEDPYCCQGPNTTSNEGASSWVNETDLTGTGTDLEPVALLPLTTSGANAQFTLINGVYQPVIQMTAGEVYRWRFVQASTMKWMDLTLNQTGCQIGLYSRDATMLHNIPRTTDHIYMSAANRVDALVSCAPGVYTLSTGNGPLQLQEDCESTHCMLLQQDVLATIVVTEDPAVAPTPPTFETCQPSFPIYLQDLRNATDVKQHGLMNFTNPTLGSEEAVPNSAACAVNGLLFMDSAPMQETIGDLLELELANIDVHPYHHHTQPFQIVALPDATNASDPGAWQVGDWVDTLLLPQLSKAAVVRWVPGPANMTGTGYGLLHCHILPHEDEGCMMKTQILERRYVAFPREGISSGGVAGITLASLVGAGVLIWGLVFLKRRRSDRKWREAHQAPLAQNAVEP